MERKRRKSWSRLQLFIGVEMAGSWGAEPAVKKVGRTQILTLEPHCSFLPPWSEFRSRVVKVTTITYRQKRTWWPHPQSMTGQWWWPRVLNTRVTSNNISYSANWWEAVWKEQKTKGRSWDTFSPFPSPSMSVSDYINSSVNSSFLTLDY